MKDFYHLTRLKNTGLLFASLLGLFLFCSTSAYASGNVILYTPYTTISVPPGKTINYTVRIINHNNTVENLGLFVSGMPRGWHYTLKSGGWNIKKIAILPKGKQIVTLSVEVPLKINKGYYHFKLFAGLNNSLPLTVEVSKKGTYKTTFTVKQNNMEGHGSSSFEFYVAIHNLTAEQQSYSLRSGISRGWDITFMSDYKDVTFINVNPNTKKNLEIKVKPPANIKAGTYTIPIEAVTKTTSAHVNLIVIITGTYHMTLTTPTGLVSTSITSGDQKRLELIVRNYGSAVLRNITPSYQAPSNWKVTFDPKVISAIQPGEYTRLYAIIKTDKKAIAGDYMTKITVRNPYASSNVSFRVSVKTPMLWGWIGVLIILIALGLVYYLFRKYGRR